MKIGLLHPFLMFCQKGVLNSLFALKIVTLEKKAYENNSLIFSAVTNFFCFFPKKKIW